MCIGNKLISGIKISFGPVIITIFLYYYYSYEHGYEHLGFERGGKVFDLLRDY
jgi:hypothetical protein